MEIKEFERLKRKLDELEDIILEVINDYFEILELDGLEEIETDLTNVQEKINIWLSENQTLEEAKTNQEPFSNVYGYLFNSASYHGDRFEFEGNMKNMANFIMSNEADRIIITDKLDNLLVSTYGTFLDKVTSDKMLIELLEELVPRQQGDVDIEEVVYIQEGTSIEELNQMGQQMT